MNSPLAGHAQPLCTGILSLECAESRELLLGFDVLN